jgi:hypothetical protein
MTPEQRARRKRSQQLEKRGWLLQLHADVNTSVARGAAIREFQHRGGLAGYPLSAGGPATGVVVVIPKRSTVIGVETPSRTHAEGLLHYRLPRTNDLTVQLARNHDCGLRNFARSNRDWLSSGVQR